MPDRAALVRSFLKRSGWDGCARDMLAGDASSRRYERLRDQGSGRQAVLMDAPPDTGEDVRPFTKIARHLRALGLSAPEILAEDVTDGFLLLEDLGDDLFARVAGADPRSERQIYAAATDLLAMLHRQKLPPDVAAYDPPMMAGLAALVFDWYPPAADLPESERIQRVFRAELETVLTSLTTGASTLILRDFHAENLIWLPQRHGIAKVGLLDFQSAMTGHPAYDLMSLLQDARRDVSPVVQDAMIDRYLAASGQPEAEFRAAFAALGAQRHLRVIGGFSRLCIRDGKPQYIDLVPRVWNHLQHCLCHPALATLKPMVAASIPAPTAEIRQRIKDRCQTNQTH